MQKYFRCMYEMPLRTRASVFSRPTGLSGGVVKNVHFSQEYHERTR